MTARTPLAAQRHSMGSTSGAAHQTKAASATGCEAMPLCEERPAITATSRSPYAN